MPRHKPSGNDKGAVKRSEINRLYAHPIPIAFFNLSLFRRHALGLLGYSNLIADNPQCTGVFDVDTQSVWIVNNRDSMILWRRGFFGKGSLSRSEPTWLARQQDGYSRTAEEITAQRRMARNQFKAERARALAEAAEQAEAVFAAGGEIQPPTLPSRPAERSIGVTDPMQRKPVGHFDTGLPEDPDTDVVEDLEHLQLTLQEAFFLAWGLDCLVVLHKQSQLPMSLREIWTSFQTAACPSSPFISRPDNPFIIKYVVYHHFRSLGWVVKDGLKFCADYLLYKRGPVFAHAEFALVICPVYEDQDDQLTAPYELPNSRPFTWSWLSTLNRVNTQVQKSLILVYVTIPALKTIEQGNMASPAILARYIVREVTLKRFVPARMRD